MANINTDKPLYGIRIAAELIGVKARALRIYEENGIITPVRTSSNRRLYSQKDIEKLEYIYFLTHIKKVNIAGVKVILGLLDLIKDKKKRQKFISAAEQKIRALNAEKEKNTLEKIQENENESRVKE